MSKPDDREQARLLFYIGIAGGVLCLATVLGAVALQVLGPVFGVAVGSIDPAIVFALLGWAGVAFGLIPAAAWFSRKSNEP